MCVLANSTKYNERCVAGIEMIKDEAGVFQRTQTWLRPVSGRPVVAGALSLPERAYEDGSDPCVLDVARVPLLGPAHDPIQPENWQVDTAQRWQRIGRVRIERIHAALEQPESLWLAPGSCKPDRIPPGFLKTQREIRSLHLIQPESIHLEIYHATNAWRNLVTLRREAVFTYNGQEYRLSVTDPAIEKKYDPHPDLSAPPRVIELAAGNRCYLCVSYTPEYHGFHYKIVASILELPA